MRLYAITSRKSLHAHAGAGSSEAALERRLIDRIQSWSAAGVQIIQLREKDLNHAQLTSLAREALARIDRRRTKLLINVTGSDAAALAADAGADGVHLAGPPVPGISRAVHRCFGSRSLEPVLSVPCHSMEEIRVAAQEGVDLILFSPVFEKADLPPQGLEGLRRACAEAQGIPVFALGGVTTANAAHCLAAGAAGVAGIRLFTGEDWRRLPAANGA